MITLAHASAAEPFEWHAHPDVWLLVALLLGGYFLALRYWGPLHAGDGPVATTRQKAAWVAGVAFLWVGADWPVHELSEDYLFSIHMVQHLIFTFIAAPLLLLGVPRWLMRRLLAPRALKSAVRVLARPVVALFVFNGLIVFTHWPVIVDLALRVELAHFVLHVVLTGSALMMWWPVVAPLPEMPSLSDPAKMLYLFLQSVVPTVPASFLTFAQTPIYDFYASVPRIWGLDVVTDQMIAGLVMKLGGGLLLWGVIAVLFFKWHAKEESQTIEEVSWDDFERELEAWNLRK